MFSNQVNYSSVVGQCAAESGRTNVTVNAESGSDFNSGSLRDITFLIRPTNFLDAQNSYLRFRCRLKATTSAVLTAPNVTQFGKTYAGILTLDNPGALSLFNKATVQSADGKTITEMDSLAAIALAKIRRAGPVYQDTIGVNMLGYNSSWEQNKGVTGLDGAVRCNAEIGLDNYQYYPSCVRIANAAGTYTGDWVEYSIPMSHFSGLFECDGGQYLPLRSFSSRTHALQLTINMEDANRALVFASTKVDYANLAAVSAEVAKITASYELSNVELVTEWVDMGVATIEAVQSAVTETGVAIKFEDTVAQSDSGFQSGTSYTHSLSKLTYSLKDVVVQLRDASQMKGLQYATNSQTRQFNLSQWGTKIGNKYYPSAGISLRASTGTDGAGLLYNSSVYAEQIKNSGGLCSRGAHTYMTAVHDPSRAAFQLGVDYDIKARSSDGEPCAFDQKFMISGVDTRSSSSVCVFEYQRTTDLNTDVTGTPIRPLHITTIFHTDNLCLVGANGVSPMERP